MNQDKSAMQSEMDRFEAEISSLVKPPGFTPAIMMPSSLMRMRRPPAPPTRPRLLAPPRPTPVIISGAPQVYRSLTPSQLIPRHVRPPLIRGAPPITTTTGLGLGASPRLPITGTRFPAVTATAPSAINDTVSAEASSSVASTITPLDDTAKAGSTNAAMEEQKKGKKKKKKEGGEGKPKKHIRSAGGTVWEDPTLLDWDPKDFRLFCGDLGNDVTDEVLTRVFSRYPSFVKAKVIRDKRTNKTKGYGFVSFKDPNDFVKAIRELDGRYVGSRPIKLRKSTWENRGLGQVRKREKQQKQLLGIIKPDQ